MTQTSAATIDEGMLIGWNACARERGIIMGLFPNGVPLTRENGDTLERAGVDVVFGLLSWHFQFFGSGSNMAQLRDLLIVMIDEAIYGYPDEERVTAALVGLRDALIDVNYQGAIRITRTIENMMIETCGEIDRKAGEIASPESWRPRTLLNLVAQMRYVIQSYQMTQSGGTRIPCFSMCLRLLHNLHGQRLQDTDDGIPYWHRGYYREVRDALYDAIGVA